MIREAQYCEIPSGLAVPMHYAEDLAVDAAREQFTGIDLFAGAGGMSLGFIQAGGRVIAACDNDVICAITYLVNLGAYPCQMHFVDPAGRQLFDDALNREFERSGVFPVAGSNAREVLPGGHGVGHYFFGDVRQITGRQILDAVGLERGKVGCVFGGPPCQGFSTSGKRQVHDPRNSLVFEFCRLVVEIMPRTIILENVPGILSMVTPDGTPVVDAIAAVLEDGGFAARDTVHRMLSDDPTRRTVTRSRKTGSKKRRRPARRKGAA